MQSKAIRGAVLAELLEEYVQTLNKGSVPNVSAAWDSYMQKESGELMQYAKETIENKVQEVVAAEMPMPTKRLSLLFDDIRTEALDVFSDSL